MQERGVLYAGGLGLFLLIYVLAGPVTYGDSPYYVADVLAYVNTGGTRRLWEFGHLFWRPLGWLVWLATRSISTTWFGSDSWSQILAAFVLLSTLSGAGVSLVSVAIGRTLGLSRFQILATTALIVCLNAMLTWTLSGSAYISGFLLQLLSVNLILRGTEPAKGQIKCFLWAGFFLGLSVLLWFPNVLSVPAVVLLAYTWRRESASERLKFASLVGAAAILLIALAYSTASIVLGITTPQQFLAWMNSSSHGMTQNRGLLRIATGLPRGFIDMGNDGMILKRFVFHDPYAPVSLLDVLFLNAWKIPLIYFGLLALIWRLYQSRERWGILLPLLAASIPVLFFAVVLFEASSAERYLPAVTLLVPGIAIVAREFQIRRHADKLLALCAVCIVLVNVWSYAKPDPVRDPAIARIQQVQPLLKPSSRVVILSFFDDIPQFYHNFPFDPVARKQHLPLYGLTIPGMPYDPFPAFAKAAKETWEAGGDVWVSRRLWAERPRPEWDWVEGDNPAVTWKKLRAYFQQLETAEGIGGEDGFVAIPISSRNSELISATLTKPAR